MARYYNSYREYLSPPPLQLCCFMGVLFLFLGFTIFVDYESMWEDIMDQFKFFLILFPVVLLLALHWLSNNQDNERGLLFPFPQQESIHRAGGSPWGVALLLVFLIFMISHHSSIRESWWPLLTK